MKSLKLLTAVVISVFLMGCSTTGTLFGEHNISPNVRKHMSVPDIHRYASNPMDEPVIYFGKEGHSIKMPDNVATKVTKKGDMIELTR